MQILRVSVEADREKIEIRQIGEQYQHAESRKPLAPLCSEPGLQLRCEDEEGPEPGKSVRYWRGHRTKCVSVWVQRTRPAQFACGWTLALPEACRKCLRSSRKSVASQSWPEPWLARWRPTRLRVFDYSGEFSSEHVVQQLHWMTGALGPGHYANISEREITREIFQRVR